MTDAYTADALFAGKEPVVRETYDRLLEVLHELGPFKVEPKKTSIHLVNTVGFAGVHPRKSFLYLNLRTEKPIESPRVAKTEQVSKNRYHNEIKLEKPNDVDSQLCTWLKEAYLLG
ncbi:hypothetical protein SE17_14195 [Kouleothrix aurantiaca]|uniref:DUF5655 domain-containing protein n=1 Tax=Kouleothrix aurantiaca TaxID=186479 RepID=A0A0P9D3S6_9CHLR|nr:hypothetical protein SE17_14195 [Kouleothrix aurantiaca]